MNTNASRFQESVNIPLNPEAHEWANKFASAHKSIEKQKQVYLNTLAVYAVHTYLSWIQVKTALEDSDSWDLSTNALFDVCDLELPNIGKLVCCPVLSDEDSFTPPDLLLPDSIAFVPVRFQEVLDHVDILGYRPIVEPDKHSEPIYVDFLEAEDIEDGYDDGSSLFPIENLLSWLFYVEDVKERLEDGNLDLTSEIRKRLEEQMRSPAQFVVESIYKARTQVERMFPDYGMELLIGSSPAIGVAHSHLGGSDKAVPETNNPEDIKLKEIGGQWLSLVKQIITS